jgi:hypothetical protein
MPPIIQNSSTQLPYQAQKSPKTGFGKTWDIMGLYGGQW